MDLFLVYTDGSCSAKDRVGGFAWKIVDENDDEHVGGGTEHDTTISRMELMAAISALNALEPSPNKMTGVLLFSDSEYVVKGFMNPSRKRNTNVDLWLWLDELANGFEFVQMEHVKGHAGNRDNEDVDKLAGEFRQAGLHEGVS